MAYAELRTKNPAQQLYVRAISSAWQNGIQLHDPSVWQLRDPEVEEKMLRDADIRHAVGYRRTLIAGRDWNLEPQRESPTAPLAVHVGTELLKKIKRFPQARLNLARAFLSGARFARIHGAMKVLPIGDGVPRVWWCPVWIEDLDKRMFRIAPDHDGAELTGAHWEVWDIDRAIWRPLQQWESMQTIKHVYDDDQAALGHGAALREALGWWWYAKTHVFAESLQAVERFAQGIIHARVDGVRDAGTGRPNRQLIDDWTRVLEDLQSRHVLVTDSSDAVEVIRGNSEGYQLLTDIRAELRNTIHTLVMGANLTTAADEGGSYALAEVQENSTEALVQYDRAALEESLTGDLLGCVWAKNWPNMLELGIAEERPDFNIAQEKRLDPEVRANVAATLNGMGVDLAREDVLEQTGFRLPEVGEDIIPGGSAAPAGLPGGFPPMPGGFGAAAR